MQITRKSTITGLTHEMNLPITQQELDRWQGGELIQDVFPYLSDDQREFLKTGITAEEWEEAFGEEE
jgi:hypothetical protein|tara:strand:+ start:478 stop:678 length:201 start_codon:yes stop_codon:yes gene_type:complete